MFLVEALGSDGKVARPPSRPTFGNGDGGGIIEDNLGGLDVVDIS